MGRSRRQRVERTDDWEQLQLLCRRPEQVAYEEIRPLVLFGDSVTERARTTGSAQRSLYRRVYRFGSRVVPRRSSPPALPIPTWRPRTSLWGPGS